ncbi:MAG: murein L,D-transpeptidase, partial [Myxococcales bacterium]
GTVAPVRALAPKYAGYAQLRSALASLRAAATTGAWPQIPAGPLLKEGDRDERVAVLRARLAAGGDTTAAQEAPTVFDAPLAEALAQWQARHGLEPDGRLGPATLKALNVPVEARIRDIEENLERWRWLPEPAERFAMVNLVASELVVYEGGQEVLRSRVINGRPDWPTPVLSDEVVALHVNPRWYVPRKITVAELLDVLKRDPAWAAAQGFVVQTGSGERLDPRDIDWSAVGADSLPGSLMQEPGPDNPLGRYKLVLTNRRGIYLHGTPSEKLFELPMRYFSHGCVRVEAIERLAELVARGEGERRRLDEARASEVPVEIELAQRLPVHLLYFTAWAEPDGRLRFAPDVYRRDGVISRALARCAEDPAGKGCR